MKTNKKPQFDGEGYQVNMEEINGEKLPDVSKLKFLSRARAGLPNAAHFRRALAELRAEDPSSYARARKKAGLTQEQFATTIGVKVSTYRQWEHGRRVPTGPAMTLMHLLASRPVLIRALQKEYAGR